MAADYNKPALPNLISGDVPAIKDNVTAAIKWRPDTGANVPVGSWRVVMNSSSQWEFQQLQASGTWSRGITFNLTATSLNGKNWSTNATPGAIPVYDSGAHLPGSIRGNAATANKWINPIKIQVSGAVASTARDMDGSTDIDIPINLIFLDDKNRFSGQLPIACGGTGRTDGASQDVVVGSNAGNVLAKSFGQIGQCRTVDQSAAGWKLSSLTVDGRYTVNCAQGAAQEFPVKFNLTGVLEVFSAGHILWQRLYLPNQASYWMRRSTSKGASWDQPWIPCGGGGSFNSVIWISKNGSDQNTGLEQEYPVTTVTRALQITDGLGRSSISPFWQFRFGAGNWGTLNWGRKPYIVWILPFDGGSATSDVGLPHFGSLTFANGVYALLRSPIIEGQLQIVDYSYVGLESGYMQYETIYMHSGGYLRVDNIADTDTARTFGCRGLTTGIKITVFDDAVLNFKGRTILHLHNSTSGSRFLWLARNGHLHYIEGQLAKSSGTAVYTGKKFELDAGTFTSNSGASGGATGVAQLNVAVPGTTSGTIINGALINGHPYGYALAANVLPITGGDINGQINVKGNLIVTKTGAKVYYDDPTAVTVGTNPASSIVSHQTTYRIGAQYNALAIHRGVLYADGAVGLDWGIIPWNTSLRGIYRWLNFKVAKDGTASLNLPFTPGQYVMDGSAPTCGWCWNYMKPRLKASWASGGATPDKEGGTAYTWVISNVVVGIPVFVIAYTEFNTETTTVSTARLTITAPNSKQVQAGRSTGSPYSIGPQKWGSTQIGGTSIYAFVPKEDSEYPHGSRRNIQMQIGYNKVIGSVELHAYQ